jgi:hypothetical protein
MADVFRLFASLMRKMIRIALILLLLPATMMAQQYTLKSPDGVLKAEVNVAGNIHFRLYRGKRILMHSKPIALLLKDKRELGKGEVVKDVRERRSEQRGRPPWCPCGRPRSRSSSTG